MLGAGGDYVHHHYHDDNKTTTATRLKKAALLAETARPRKGMEHYTHLALELGVLGPEGAGSL